MNTIVRVLIAAAAPACLVALAPSAALAKVHIAVDLDAQTIHVESKDRTFDWKVSSGKTGYDTPAGSFKVLWMDKDHHSDEYEQAYMPYAIFFAPGFAIHGFGKSPWGHKASHGCVRLPLDKAAVLFDLVKAEGADIAIVGVSNREAPTVAEAERKRRDAETASAAPDARSNGYDEDYAAPPRRQAARASGYNYADPYYAPQPQQPTGFGQMFGGFY